MSKAIPQTTQIGYITEVTDGTTPASPAFQIMRCTGESLEVSRKHAFSSELNGRRGQKNFAIASSFGQGGMEFEFTDGTLEDFLESALRSAWSTDVLTDGNTPKSFTLETKFESGATDVYKRLKGAQVDTIALKLSPGEIITGKVDFKSRIGDYANAIVASATYVAGNTEPLMVGAKVGSLAMTGLTFDHIASLTWNLNNNLSFQEALTGSLNPVGIAPGTVEITGQLSLFVDSTMYNILSAAQDGTSTGLSFTINTVTLKKTTFNMTNVVLSDLKSEAGAANGPSVMATMNYRALQDPSVTGGSAITITRNIA